MRLSGGEGVGKVPRLVVVGVLGNMEREILEPWADFVRDISIRVDLLMVRCEGASLFWMDEAENFRSIIPPSKSQGACLARRASFR